MIGELLMSIALAGFAMPLLASVAAPVAAQLVNAGMNIGKQVADSIGNAVADKLKGSQPSLQFPSSNGKSDNVLKQVGG
ncbi:hypothetical protein CQ048_19570 [Pseudomonas trivialis]|nr:hypothetical protein CQ048_19570 [Pseudomonas trivialis]PRB24706.1 hypothetical protein CQ041_18700 [Pseudomonas sp. MYb60]